MSVARRARSEMWANLSGILGRLTDEPGVQGAVLVTLVGRDDGDVQLGARWSSGVLPLHVRRWLRDTATLAERGWTATELVPLGRACRRELAFCGVESEVLGGLIRQDGGVIGWLAAFPSPATRERPQLEAWERARDEIRDAMADAPRLPEEKATVIVCPDGGPQWGCPRSAPWLRSPELPAELLTLAREFVARGDEQAVTHTGLATAHLTRLTHGRGCRVLVELTPARPLPEPLQARLSPRQLEVASYLEVGATLDEIAATLSIGRETVRTHAKAIYRRLEVSTRLDLSRLLQPVWPHTL